MAKHTNCFSVFNHFVGLALKGLKKVCFYSKRKRERKRETDNQQSPTYSEPNQTFVMELFCENS